MASNERAAEALAWELSMPIETIDAALAAQGLHVVTTAERDELAQLRERVRELERLLDYHDVNIEAGLEALRGQ